MGRMKEVFQRQQEEDLYYGYREDAPWTDAELEQQYQDWLKEQETPGLNNAGEKSNINTHGKEHH